MQEEHIGFAQGAGSSGFDEYGRIIQQNYLFLHTNVSSSVLLNVVQAFTRVVGVSMFVDANGTCGGASLFCDSFSSFIYIPD